MFAPQERQNDGDLPPKFARKYIENLGDLLGGFALITGSDREVGGEVKAKRSEPAGLP